ncbi:hypothetical protein JOF55_000044 [Haloactinomyces albus]|uniref:Uncharacterized protein n=1 Tax=Haloactinomyces albus TaxID=1352928 RepID=A0AAE4CMQ9_9ACTN|nr:hypothetical protein [Haloactinomyces albus]
MAGLVRWLGDLARELERARMVMRHPQSRAADVAQRRVQG